MNAAYKLFILAFMFYSAKAFLRRKDYGPIFTKIADECHDICIDVTGTTQDAIKQVRMGNFIEDKEVQRYILCLWRVSRVMDKNLVVNRTLLDYLLPKKEIKDGFDCMEIKCLIEAQKKGFTEKYEVTYDLAKCMFKINPTDFLMP